MSADHLSWPFGGTPTDQDSPGEIRDCALVALSFSPGQREDHPSFGARPGAHRQGGVDLGALAAQLAEHDPRTAALVTGNDPALLARLRRTDVLVQVGREG